MLCLLLVGCAHSSRRITSENIQRLQQGQDAAEVHRVVGKPVETHHGALGQRVEMYSEQSVLGMEGVSGTARVQFRTAHVLYNADGKVKKFLFHENVSPVKTGVRWLAGRLIKEEELERIVKDATTGEELYEFFGPPMVRGLTLNGDTYLSWQFQDGRGVWSIKRELFVVMDESSVVRAFRLRDLAPEANL